MKLKEAVKAALEEFFQKHRTEVIDAIKENLAEAPVVIVYFEEMDDYNVWSGDGEVSITQREIVDTAYYLDVYHACGIEIDTSNIEDLGNSDDDISEVFARQIGGGEKEDKFYKDLYSKEIKEILKDFQYKKVGETFYVFKKSRKATAR